ncbi:uncharacterized protein LOC117109090 isoform X1 [Anneissia japonica]|uniref:uncharacterized protein LOC117109090 isoform X1 n=1 Tax=Anneissia japonica TaxID=1529436 RepID=UPI001425701C|nr:uncharacterized protein LOC117109090 isoform X1 [Anneissia japonica]
MSHPKRRSKLRTRPTFNLMGFIVCKSPLMTEKNGNKMFLFELRSRSQQFIIAKGNQWQLYNGVQVHKYIELSNAISTTITKGLDEQIKVFACTSKTKVSVIDEGRLKSLEQNQNSEMEESCASVMSHHFESSSSGNSEAAVGQLEQSSKPTSYQGKVTKIIDSSAGIYELDDNIRLYLTYLNKDIGCVVPEIRVDSCVTVYNAHLKTVSKVPCLVCCMRSHVEVVAVTSPSYCISLNGCLVKLTTQFIPGFYMLTRLQFLVRQLTLKLPEKFHRKISKMIGNIIETDIEPCLLPRKRNVYAEFLRSPHQTCIVDDVQPQIKIKNLFSLPSLDELKKEIIHQFTNSNCCRGKSYGHYVSSSTTFKNPKILIAFLTSNAATGTLSLQDETGSIDCVVTSLKSDSLPSHICKHISCFQRKDQSLYAPYSYICPYAHVWNLNGLLKISQFLMIHEQFSKGDDAVMVRSYIMFDMRQAVYITSHNLSSTTCFKLPSTSVTSKELTTIGTQDKMYTIKIIKKGNLMKRLTKTESSISFTIDAIMFHDTVPNVTNTASQDAGLPSAVTLDKSNNPTSRNVVVKFEGAAVKWYPVLYAGCCYQIIKHTCVDDNWKILEKMSNQCTLTVNERDVIQQCMVKSSNQYADDSDVVLSVEGIISSFKSAKKVVSFTGVVAVCGMYNSQTPSQHGSVYMHLKVIDTASSIYNYALSLPVSIQCSVQQYPLGILPQALICIRGVEVNRSKGKIHCQSGALTSIQILHIPSTVTENNVHGEPEVTSEAQTTYGIHILRSLLSGNKETNFIINGFITALYSLNIRWLCFLCKSHEQCTCCLSDEHAEGCMSFSARLLIDDGTASVHVWCTESQSIASILGLPDHRWQQILDVIKRDGPFHFNLFNDLFDKCDVKNLLKQLCMSNVINHPIQLHCSSAYLRSTDERSSSEQLWVQATVSSHN